MIQELEKKEKMAQNKQKAKSSDYLIEILADVIKRKEIPNPLYNPK